jgi:hypothetical protein
MPQLDPLPTEPPNIRCFLITPVVVKCIEITFEAYSTLAMAPPERLKSLDGVTLVLWQTHTQPGFPLLLTW